MIEFLGCLAALGGGVVLGSVYLGVDVKAMAIVILEKADIEIPAMLNGNHGVSDEPPTAETPSDDAAAFDGATKVVQRAAGEPAAVEVPEALTETAAAAETAAYLAEQVELSDDEKQAATRAFWLELNQSAQEESANRSKSINDRQSWHLFEYLLHRKKGHQQAADAIEALDQRGVDRRIRLHAQQLLTWHKAGTQLYDRAAQLLTDAPAGKLSGPFAQSWQSAATQHRMEEQLLLNKHAAVASYLEHAYTPSDSSER